MTCWSYLSSFWGIDVLNSWLLHMTVEHYGLVVCMGCIIYKVMNVQLYNFNCVIIDYNAKCLQTIKSYLFRKKNKRL